jgi:divalent metal cation (Fe/Co/Zn/Cd) transporter
MTDQIPALKRRARWLAGFTVGWNVLEGVVAISFGIADESVALLGFGMDSWVEVGAAAMVLWRLRGGDRKREKKAAAVIAVLLGILATTTVIASGLQLYSGSHPETTWPGVVIAGVSLSFMGVLWKTKSKVAEALNDTALRADAACSRGCLELSVVLLAGSLIYAIAPTLWWVDSVAAVGLAILIGREGLGTWRASQKPEAVGCGGCC